MRSGRSPSSARSTPARRASAPAPAPATATRPRARWPTAPTRSASRQPTPPATRAVATRAFSVADAEARPQPPDTTITKGPKKTQKTRPKFKFSSTDPAATFQCKLDSGKFVACASPFRTPRAASGQARSARQSGRRRRDRRLPGGPEVPRPAAGLSKSGRPDLNRGPHRPERCALPGCATPRERKDRGACSRAVVHRIALDRGRQRQRDPGAVRGARPPRRRDDGAACTRRTPASRTPPSGS